MRGRSPLLGGSLGLAVLASLAASRTDALVAAGRDGIAALHGGYQAAFLVGALFAALAAGLGAILLRAPAPADAGHVEGAAAPPAEALGGHSSPEPVEE